jgi:hypothetical protein
VFEMNLKLTVLYKELPWLESIADTIGNPSVVKVKRLDAQSITRWTGHNATPDDYYWIIGYFFDKNGTRISRILPEKPVGIIAHLKRWAQRRVVVTVEDALKRYAAKDAVRYVVLFGHDLDHYGALQLYVYKMPEDVTVSELLHNIEEDRARWATQKLEEATVKLNAELSEAKQK